MRLYFSLFRLQPTTQRLSTTNLIDLTVCGCCLLCSVLRGSYLDEIAYDRTTMLRGRRVLGDGGMIDHHCHIGFVSRSCVMNYMELYPFITRLWCKCDNHVRLSGPACD